jgi:predicted TIM-barrel fold metal-dependent hydrolase
VSSSEANEYALRAHTEFPDRLIPYAYAVPHIAESALDHVERAVTDLGFRGIKVHGGEARLTEYIIDPVFEMAGKAGVPCLVDFKGELDQATRLAASFPETTIIAAHVGRYLCVDGDLLDRFIRLAEERENVILDTSGVVLNWVIPEAVRRVGSDRMVFGIDGPHPYPDPETYAREEINRIRSSSISGQDKENLLWGTISRILKL